MADKYRVTTEDGTYEVTTGDSQPSGEEAFNSFKPSPAAKFMFGVGKMLNPAPMVDAVRNPVDTGKGILNAMAQEREKASNAPTLSEKVGHGLASVLPVLGPAAAGIGEKIGSGDVAGGLGEATGLVAPMAFSALRPESIPGTGTNAISRKMYQSALKPPPGSYDLGEVRSMVDTGLKEGIPVSEGGVKKLDKNLGNLHQQAQDIIATNPNAPVNKYAVSSRLLDTYRKFKTQATPSADIKAIENARDDFLNTQPDIIRAADAQALKSGTYRQLKDKAFGELKSADVESQKGLARGLKEEVNQIFPELEPIQASESDQYGLRPALQRAVRRISNHDLLSLSTYLAGGIGAEAFGHPGVAGAFGAGALVKILGDPAVKSRLAIAINAASNNKLGTAGALARITTALQTLNQAGEQQNIPPTRMLAPDAPQVNNSLAP